MIFLAGIGVVFIFLLIVLFIGFPIFYFMKDVINERWSRGEMSEGAKEESIKVLSKVLENVDRRILSCPLNEEIMLVRLAIYKEDIQEAIDTIKFLKRKK